MNTQTDNDTQLLPETFITELDDTPQDYGDRQKTKRGTPCSPQWTDDWIKRVNDAESKLDKQICGARLPDGTPCTLKPNHPNGRCRYHGGFRLTGAQQGNRNAVIHGLYSQRLQTCGPACPQWERCPCAGSDVVNLGQKNALVCPYEQAEFTTAVNDAASFPGIASDPYAKHLVHHLAMLQVMTTRAAAAMRHAEIIEIPYSNEHCDQFSSKQTCFFRAFMRVAAEYRRVANLLYTKVHPGHTHDAARAPVSYYQPRRPAPLPLETKIANLEPPTRPDLRESETPTRLSSSQAVEPHPEHDPREGETPVEPQPDPDPPSETSDLNSEIPDLESPTPEGVSEHLDSEQSEPDDEDGDKQEEPIKPRELVAFWRPAPSATGGGGWRRGRRARRGGR